MTPTRPSPLEIAACRWLQDRDHLALEDAVLAHLEELEAELQARLEEVGP